MQDCADFGSLRMDQRFEIMNEELASVCSKFSHGKVNLLQNKSVYEIFETIKHLQNQSLCKDFTL